MRVHRQDVDLIGKFVRFAASNSGYFVAPHKSWSQPSLTNIFSLKPTEFLLPDFHVFRIPAKMLSDFLFLFPSGPINSSYAAPSPIQNFRECFYQLQKFVHGFQTLNSFGQVKIRSQPRNAHRSNNLRSTPTSVSWGSSPRQNTGHCSPHQAYFCRSKSKLKPLVKYTWPMPPRPLLSPSILQINVLF